MSVCVLCGEETDISGRYTKGVKVGGIRNDVCPPVICCIDCSGDVVRIYKKEECLMPLIKNAMKGIFRKAGFRWLK